MGRTKESVEAEIKKYANLYKGICPRCGRVINGYPALSRYANVNICSDCGTEEALNGFAGIQNDFDKWTM